MTIELMTIPWSSCKVGNGSLAKGSNCDFSRADAMMAVGLAMCGLWQPRCPLVRTHGMHVALEGLRHPQTNRYSSGTRTILHCVWGRVLNRGVWESVPSCVWCSMIGPAFLFARAERSILHRCFEFLPKPSWLGLLGGADSS